jgi:hypothetical protein
MYTHVDIIALLCAALGGGVRGSTGRSGSSLDVVIIIAFLSRLY